jgi:hypothetical protein
MDMLLITAEQAWQTLALVFGGVVFGAVASALVTTYWWSQRSARLEEKGERYRERMKGRFTRLHNRADHHA